ncbi:MAG: hypothetical protein Q7S87_11125 [Agitococcus sp.]|nr:hypothetical protein [Agitococcus sp.]
MKIGLLAVSVLLASTAFAREEDSPLPIEDVTPTKVEKAVVVKPSQPALEEAVKPKPTAATENTKEVIKKANSAYDELPKKKVTSVTTDETAKKKTTTTNDEVIKKKTITATEESPKKKVTAIVDESAKKKIAATDETAKKKVTPNNENSPQKQTSTAINDAPKKKVPTVVEVVVPKPPTTVSVSALAATTVTPSAAAEPTISPRQQQTLIDNAVKIDGMNRDLLTQNEKMQLENEKLAQQVELLQHDRSAEYMRNGAFFVVLGLFCGWLLSNAPRQRKKW